MLSFSEDGVVGLEAVLVEHGLISRRVLTWCFQIPSRRRLRLCLPLTLDVFKLINVSFWDLNALGETTNLAMDSPSIAERIPELVPCCRCAFQLLIW